MAAGGVTGIASRPNPDCAFPGATLKEEGAVRSYIPKLARFAQRPRAAAPPGIAAGRMGSRRPAPARVKEEHLAELVPIIRRRLAIAPAFSDAAILASLTSIAARSSHEERWRRAAGSTLGLWLSSYGRDLNGALTMILALLPKPPLS